MKKIITKTEDGKIHINFKKLIGVCFACIVLLIIIGAIVGGGDSSKTDSVNVTKIESSFNLENQSYIYSVDVFINRTEGNYSMEVEYMDAGKKIISNATPLEISYSRYSFNYTSTHEENISYINVTIFDDKGNIVFSKVYPYDPLINTDSEVSESDSYSSDGYDVEGSLYDSKTGSTIYSKGTYYSDHAVIDGEVNGKKVHSVVYY